MNKETQNLIKIREPMLQSGWKQYTVKNTGTQNETGWIRPAGMSDDTAIRAVAKVERLEQAYWDAQDFLPKGRINF